MGDVAMHFACLLLGALSVGVTANSTQFTSSLSPGPNEAVIVLAVFVTILSTAVIVLVLLIILRYKLCKRYGQATLETGDDKGMGERGTLLSGVNINLKNETRKPKTYSKGVNTSVKTVSKSVGTVIKVMDKKLDPKISGKTIDKAFHKGIYAMNLNGAPEMMKDNVSQTQEERPCTPLSLKLVKMSSIECQTDKKSVSKRKSKKVDHPNNTAQQNHVTVMKDVSTRQKPKVKRLNDRKANVSPETMSIKSAPTTLLGNSATKSSKKASHIRHSKSSCPPRLTSASAGPRKPPTSGGHKKDGVNKRRRIKRKKDSRIRPHESATSSILSKWDTVSAKQKLEYPEEMINESNEERTVEPVAPLSKDENRLYHVLQSVTKSFFDSERRNDHLLQLMEVGKSKDKRKKRSK